LQDKKIFRKVQKKPFFELFWAYFQKILIKQYISRDLEVLKLVF